MSIPLDVPAQSKDWIPVNPQVLAEDTRQLWQHSILVTIEMVFAQKMVVLVRSVCRTCREKYHAPVTVDISSNSGVFPE